MVFEDFEYIYGGVKMEYGLERDIRRGRDLP